MAQTESEIVQGIGSDSSADASIDAVVLGEAFRAGAEPRQVTRALAYAAALRIARFGTADAASPLIRQL